MDAREFFDEEPKGGRGSIAERSRGIARRSPDIAGAQVSTLNLGLPEPGTLGLTLEQYATSKALPIDFLRRCGLSEVTYDQKLAVRIPYFGARGEEVAARFRIALDGDHRFRWKSGTKLSLYGLHRLSEAQQVGAIVLVEGESDCHTLWFHGIPALGIPGAPNWREDRDARHLEGIETIYVVIESDRGGDAVRKWLSRSTIRDRAKLVTLPAKDPSALYLETPGEFPRRWQAACLDAIPWTAIESQAPAGECGETRENCGEPAVIDGAETISDPLDGLIERAKTNPGAPFAPETLQ